MKMKKILAVLMSMIVIMGVCGVGAGCDANKETEAEYKARIKKELDEIPVEATGYKLVDPTKQEVTYPEGEEPYYNLVNPHVLEVHDHEYSFCYTVINGDLFEITSMVDEGERKYVKFQNITFFNSYNDQFDIFYYDEKIFIVRYKAFNPSLLLNYKCFLPPILFYYDTEENTAKYIGYLKEWFEYKIADIRHGWLTDKMFAIVKV